MSAENGHHILPMKIYTTVFASLLFLTAVTVWIAQFDFGSLNTVIALAVATVKASLVAMYFMHLKYDDKVNAVCLVSGFFFLIVMFIFTYFDVFTRAVEKSTL